ncbi:MAG: hypothetical protein AB2417_15715 [Clostridiaceae bacterium]
MDIEKHLQSQVKDHEIRIRQLEDSDVRQQIQLANIEKSQAEIKVMINESSREQQKALNDNQKTLNEFTERILDTFTNNINNDNKTKNEVEFHNTKQFWAIVATLMTIFSSIATYYFNK